MLIVQNGRTLYAFCDSAVLEHLCMSRRLHKDV